MKWNMAGVLLFVAVLTSSMVQLVAQPTSSPTVDDNAASQPMMLDLSPFFWERFITPDRTNMELISVTGRQIFDGLPFQVDGRTHLYSRGLANARHKSADAFPDMLGVKVGRAFDELHLLHATEWTDREQEVVARVRLNYADGTHHEFPIAYGAHIRDWQRMQSEEKEIYTDPDTKVVWRGPGVANYKSTTRLSKTLLRNPFPAKVVQTIDFLSAGKIASYNLAAATVASANPARPTTAPVPLDRPERVFDASLLVRVIDEARQPIENVAVTPSFSIVGSLCATVTTPVYMDSSGSGTVRYPRKDSSCFIFFAEKDGWIRIDENPWVRLDTNAPSSKQIQVTIRMRRDPNAPLITSTALRSVNTSTTTGSTAGTGGASSGIGTATNAIAGNSSAADHSNAGEQMRAYPLLIIDFPVGSRVRVEAANDLAAAKWEEVTLFTSLPSSPYLFTCGKDCAPQPQRFYRAVRLP